MRYRFQLRFDADAGIPDRQIDPLPFERPYDDGHPNRSGGRRLGFRSRSLIKTTALLSSTALHRCANRISWFRSAVTAWHRAVGNFSAVSHEPRLCALSPETFQVRIVQRVETTGRPTPFRGTNFSWCEVTCLSMTAGPVHE